MKHGSTDWYTRAVFYQVMPRSFRDGNGDGIGDLAGLSMTLDYLQWLGVDCLWLPPFFTSPLRDGGYDISDFTGIAPEIGTIEEFTRFIERARDRGLKVVIDFVMNHTSSEHPWFQASRNDPEGPYGDFYVWREQPDAYLDARVIFVDTHHSNWSFDPVRKQYYWHRFFDHQPDLNWDNPRVAEEMFNVVRYWLDLGVDGFRLDAVPYLVEEDGTTCENLPGTHAILKQVRRIVDEEYSDRVLLCEANQWPRDVVEYFGEEVNGRGDECHMAFHFPLMPRLYMALKQERRDAISQILADTPAIPAGCQWGTFLRNHDELTLEMVSLSDREYLWANYAPEPRMRCNIGIRRRLAPLLDNDPFQIKLLHSLLLSLPGSPVLYYGDEIGMGDNIWLHDRDGVRTPMQWTGDASAGFSDAAPEDFYLPVVDHPTYGPQNINTERQLLDPSSLLMWVRHVLSIRRQHPVFGNGHFTDLGGDNPAVLAYLRHNQEETILCVANLSPEPQEFEVRIPGWEGAAGTRLLRRVPPVPIGTDGILKSRLGQNGFAWLLLTPAEAAAEEPIDPTPPLDETEAL
ncbi:maltose alpha-D-glucosyltransferase [Aestuariimicrobium sp. p3-SID1156]|uniref:maltose alpha-D-glucosyltransferase n=1 Tax=Aestuariimicrobium sp. p3-SID1156 TaxID=2916038 RepID=UPI00223A87F3|nr:maltose alpha-D-glucosyltransferase [Aestuariimicrobium sp. p3-SID1156]MCT1459467.1 maltose alpha-D-glucosyltransferase [Aestuariimicrobium sp. p3-SID1156]